MVEPRKEASLSSGDHATGQPESLSGADLGRSGIRYLTELTVGSCPSRGPEEALNASRPLAPAAPGSGSPRGRGRVGSRADQGGHAAARPAMAAAPRAAPTPEVA